MWLGGASKVAFLVCLQFIPTSAGCHKGAAVGDSTSSAQGGLGQEQQAWRLVKEQGGVIWRFGDCEGSLREEEWGS